LKRLNVSLTDETFDKLCDLSRESGKGLSALVREIVSAHFKESREASEFLRRLEKEMKQMIKIARNLQTEELSRMKPT
jgi:predicted DNA-binding protein